MFLLVSWSEWKLIVGAVVVLTTTENSFTLFSDTKLIRNDKINDKIKFSSPTNRKAQNVQKQK